MEQIILIALIKYGGEEKVELAQFYNKYANGLIQQLIVSNTGFLNMQEDAPKDEQDEQSSKNNEKAGDKKSEEKGKEIDEKKPPKGINNKRVEDDEIVYENLNAANLLLTNYLKDYDDKENKILDKSIIKYYLQLRYNYSLFTSLEKINSDFKKADNYFKLSIDICKNMKINFHGTIWSIF